MFYKFKLLAFIIALLPATGKAWAEGSFPTFSKGLPIYEVKLTTASNLPNPSFQLTKRALRILPQFFIESELVNDNEVEISDYAGKIELIHSGNMRYCESKKKLCWPKHIEAMGGYLKITSWDGNSVFYKDSKKLGIFLWNESSTPMAEIINKSDRK